ncbi:MAG: phosphoribosyltransferase, partial [Limisphaerales bacterium]
MIERFRNRSEAGRWLAQRLTHISDEPNPVVLALPRGGVPVGFEIAEHLHVPLDIFIVRKLGVPGHEEYAMGALASGGIIVLNDRVIGQVGLSRSEIDQVVRREQAELERRTREYGKAAAGSNFR